MKEHGRATFPPTRWTLIQRVRLGSEQERAGALEELCRAYWLPLYAFARHQGLSEHGAEDAVQGFILDLLERGLFDKADHNEGRLRALLLTAFRRHLSNLRVHDQAKRRGGAVNHIPLVPPDAEGRYQLDVVSKDEPPDVIYHRKWAESLVSRSIERLQARFDEQGKSERFQVMRAYLPWDGSDEDTAAGAAAAGMSPGAFRTALHRLRGQYREMVLEEVRQTIGSDDPDMVDDEIRELFKTLAK